MIRVLAGRTCGLQDVTAISYAGRLMSAVLAIILSAQAILLTHGTTLSTTLSKQQMDRDYGYDTTAKTLQQVNIKRNVRPFPSQHNSRKTARQEMLQLGWCSKTQQ